MRRALAAVAMLAGCAIPEGVEPGEEVSLAVDARFSESERAELSAAVERWRVASAGRMTVRLVGEGEPARGAVHRAPSAVAYRRATLEIWIEPGAGVESVRRLAMHYEGRLFGLPLVVNERAIMNPENVADDLTARDVDACRAVGLCP